MCETEWKQIKHLPDGYKINKFGEIKNKTNKILINRDYNSVGYLRFPVKINKKLKRFFIHRLIAEHFIDNPKNKPCVNHIDGNKTNNSIENLEWVTYKENTKHADKKGLNNRNYDAMIAHNKKYGVWNKGTKYGNTDAYKKSQINREKNYLRDCLSLLFEYMETGKTQIDLAEEIGVRRETISKKIGIAKKYLNNN